MSSSKRNGFEFNFEQLPKAKRGENESLSNLPFRSARKETKNSPDDISIQSAKRSYVDLTGEDELPEKSKNSNNHDKSKSRYNVVDVSQSDRSSTLSSTLSSYVNTNHSKKYRSIAGQPQKQNVDAFSTVQTHHRVTDQPHQKRVRITNSFKGSDSDDELAADEVGRSSSTEAKASKLLQKFQLPRGHETGTTSTKPTNVIVAIPSAERRQFLKRLEILRGPPVSVVNLIDHTSPPLSFIFVNESILGRDVERVDEEFMSGCECRPENGRNCGCEYRSCHCLQHSDKDEDGNVHFPYAASQRNRGCLRNEYLHSRHHIYECNRKCNCRDNCKNKLVQHGRQVRLEIFKTVNRGWGIRCSGALKKGQFVDTYRGEIITNDEAVERSSSRTVDQDNYLMDLDKFNPQRMISKVEMKEQVSHAEYKAIKAKVKKGDYEISVDKEDGTALWLNPNYTPPYVCDGMEVGGPTRFMNHSCDPNCRLFTVSYNHADERVYELAFFTIEEIEPGVELTFDYKDEDDRDIITDEMADEVEREKGYRPSRCLCGSEGCRRYFFN